MAADPLVALKTAVGAGSCPEFLCDFDGNGNTVTNDALAILCTAVAIPPVPNCPAAPV